MIAPMFGSLGFPELIFIFVLALLVFGPKKLPELGRTLGKAMAEFRKATTDIQRTINAELMEQELRDSDPRRLVRDTLRDAKSSIESALRDEPPRAAAPAALAAPFVPAGSPAISAADSTPAVVEPDVATAADPTAPEASLAPAGAIARGRMPPDDEGDDPTEPPRAMSDDPAPAANPVAARSTDSPAGEPATVGDKT